jgi:hypothetical protein
MPDLHFGVALPSLTARSHGFCITCPANFYQCHRDGRSNPDASPTSKSRRISAVIFLNGTSAEPRDDMYGGGALTFYELLDDPVGRSLGFPLERTKACSSHSEPTFRIASPR